MKQILKQVLGDALISRVRRARQRIELRTEFAKDRERYQTHMFPEDQWVTCGLLGRNLEAQLTKDYHRVEKGLALAMPRQPFGESVLQRLDVLIPHARSVLPASPVIGHAESARRALVNWNDSGLVDDEISPVRTVSERTMQDPANFFGTRHSVRDFDARRVEQELLYEAVSLALTTPSVCNRQPWHVRFYEGGKAAEVLRHQNGSAGFADNVPVVAIVSVDARAFAGVGERNQGWIEGGLFSMSLVWALHGLGLDSCMLNLSLRSSDIDRIRSDVGIPDHELLIMMIAIGYGRTGHRCARSPKKAVLDVVREPGA